MRRIVWDEGLFKVRALASTAEDRALLDEEGKSKGKGKGKGKARDQKVSNQQVSK